MNQIDVHVLTLPDSNPEWLAQCLESLSTEPVNVHVIGGVSGDLGASRIKGFSSGNAPFVSYVDCDDYVIRGSYVKALRSLRNCDAVITKEQVIYESGRTLKLPLSGRHFLLAKRDVVQKNMSLHENYKNTCDHVLLTALQPTQLDFIGYVWRCHSNGMHHKWGEHKHKEWERGKCPLL